MPKTKAAAAASTDEWCTVKIRRSTHTTLTALLDRASRDGWVALGANRSDPPTLGGILDELATRAFAAAVRRA